MADYIWTRTGRAAGYDTVAGEDVPDEVEALPAREIQRLLDRGYMSLKPPAIDPEDLAGKQDAATAATDAELAAAQAADDARLTDLETGVMVVVEHGENGAAARPVGAAAVYWIGTVEPVNALDNDWWAGAP